MLAEIPVVNASPTVDWVPTDVHDWEGKETNVFVLNYTMACPLQCDFCCYGCHPKRKEKMPLDRAIDLVQQAAALGKFSSVGFTGGEPMLFADELLTIGDELRRVGLPFTIATACHWATNTAKADSLVNAFADRGLIRLNISHDPSHAKFVSRDAVIHAALAASKRQIATYIVGTFYSPSESLSSFIPELADVPYISLVDKYVARVGRASKKNISQETYNLHLELDGLCCYRRVYHDMVVFYDGRVYPCCSTFNRATPGISIGNAFEESLDTLWQRLEGSLMFRLMKRQGFTRIYEIIKEHDPELYDRLPSARESVGPCSLCNKLFKNSETTQRVKRVFDEYERNKTLSIVDMMTERFEEHEVTSMISSIVHS